MLTIVELNSKYYSLSEKSVYKRHDSVVLDTLAVYPKRTKVHFLKYGGVLVMDDPWNEKYMKKQPLIADMD
jgi:hypothetical protein